MPATVIRPNSDTALPGLLFIGEPFGVNGEMRRVAHDFALSDLAVMLPDLTTRDYWFHCVRALMGDLKRGHGRGVKDLLSARSWLAHQTYVDPTRIAVLGLCMGGGFALLLAKTGLFRVAAPFYGQVPTQMDGACPIVASFGGRDRVIRPHAERLRSEVERLGITHDLKTYPGAGHSFMTRPPNRLMAAIGPLTPARAGHEPEAAADATRRVIQFLKMHL